MPLPRPSFARSALVGAALLAGHAATAAPADAQGLLDRVKRRVEQNVNRKVDEMVDCAMSDQACIRKAEAEGRKVRIDSTAARTGADGAATAATPARAGAGAWANYDFIPGPTVVFADDFSRDVIGDFPRRLTFVDGTLELVRWSERPWLRFASTGKFDVPAGRPLPARYTFEFDYYGESGECWIYPTGSDDDGYFIIAADGSGGFNVAGRAGRAEGGAPGTDVVHQARLMMDGAYAKGYVDGARVLNVPNFGAARGDRVRFYCDKTLAIGAIRIGEGGRKLYDAIAAEGRVATQGIYFDVGSDRIRPESTPTLKEIAAMLAEHPELRLSIEGHTDATGQAAANLALSTRRAAAVIAALVSGHGVDAARLESRGLGDTKPVAPNTTPEGRQQNRRVELVRR